jgi:hypothetical protein
MTVKEIIEVLQKFPDDFPVNIHMQYKAGLILRMPDMQIYYVDAEGTLCDTAPAGAKEISFFVDEALISIRKKNSGDGR